MEIKQFEQLESKIISLLEFVERLKRDKSELTDKIKDLESRLSYSVSLDEKLNVLKKENSSLRNEVEEMSEAKKKARQKAESLLVHIEKIEEGLK